jgi:hypothetical protein
LVKTKKMMINETKQRVLVDNYAGIDSQTDYCPDDLIAKAEQMKKDGIISVEIESESGWYGEHYIRVYHYRLETDSERDNRVIKEKAAAEYQANQLRLRELAQLAMLKEKYG